MLSDDAPGSYFMLHHRLTYCLEFHSTMNYLVW